MDDTEIQIVMQDGNQYDDSYELVIEGGIGKKSEADSYEQINVVYDICLVFPVDSDNFDYEGCQFERSFQPAKHIDGDNNEDNKGGWEIFKLITDQFGEKYVKLYLSVDKSQFYVLIGAPLPLLKRVADLKKTYLPLDKTGLEEIARVGWPDHGIGPLTMDSTYLRQDGIEVQITPYSPFEYIYGRYEEEKEFEKLYAKNPFTDDVRLPLMYRLLDEPTEVGGLEIRIKKCIANGVLLAAFALHNDDRISAMKKVWLSYSLPYDQPFDEIKEYFGVKIALYFQFMGNFWAWLIPAAVVGLPFQIAIVATNHQNPSNPVAPFYSLFIVLWGVLMLEYWKRKQAELGMKWGMLEYEKSEAYRSEFEEDGMCTVAGEEVMYFDPRKRRYLFAVSYSVIFILCLVVIGVVAAIQTARFYMLANHNSEGYAAVIASVMNTTQITFFAQLYAFVAKALNDYENHATDTAYEDSMITKNFVFSFVNSYSSFFFLAYFAWALPNPITDDHHSGHGYAEFQGQCGDKTCLGALAINLAIVLLVQITVGNAIEIVTPMIFSAMKTTGERSGISPAISPAEMQYLLDPYDDLIDTLGDYMEVVILFGYMVMFASALPITPFFLILSMWLEIRLDAFRILHLKQRPFPAGAQDIGTFQDVLDLLIGAAVVTNAALVVFTMNLLPSTMGQFTKFWIFVGFQWVLFAAQYYIRFLVNDMPYVIQVQKQRQDYINQKLIKREEDEDLEMFNVNDALLSGQSQRARFSSGFNDHD